MWARRAQSSANNGDGQQEDVKIVIQKYGGDWIEFKDFAGIPLIVFKTKSSVTGSKVYKGSPVKEASEEAVGFGRGKMFLMVRIFSLKYSEKTVGSSSESKGEGRGEEKCLPSMDLKF